MVHLLLVAIDTACREYLLECLIDQYVAATGRLFFPRTIRSHILLACLLPESKPSDLRWRGCRLPIVRILLHVFAARLWLVAFKKNLWFPAEL